MRIFIRAPHQRSENGTFAFQKVEERCSYHLPYSLEKYLKYTEERENQQSVYGETKRYLEF